MANGAKIGITLRRGYSACCVVRRGPPTTPTICLLRIATTVPLMNATIISGFVVLWRGSLRGKAGLFAFASFTF
jgi:hypothetical protein